MSLKQIISILTISVILSVFFMSCEKDSDGLPVGEDWVSSDTKVYFIDTLTIKNTTFKFDSIAVSSTDRLLIGAYNDPVFGFTKSKSYVQLYNTIYSLDNTTSFDSIALILKYDHYVYNDTIPIQKIYVYDLINDIEFDEDATSYYNTTQIKSNTTPIATKTFTAKPKKDDSLHITISNTFGKTLFEKLRDNKINNSDEFLKAYKGLLIEPDANNTAILGFSKSSYLRIYYSDKDELSKESLTLDMTFDATNSFHNISQNANGTVFQSLTSQLTYLPSTSTSHTTFLQAGTGIATRVDIPNLKTLYDIPGTGLIIDANLKLSVKQNTATKNLYTNDSLNVYIIDHKANIISALTDTQGDTVLALIEKEDSEFNITTYSIPVKYFLNLKLSDINGSKYYLAIYPKDFNQTVNRYILNGEAAENSIKSKLELTYAIYDK